MKNLIKLFFLVFIIGFSSCRETKKDVDTEAIETIEAEVEEISDDIEKESKEIESELDELEKL